MGGLAFQPGPSLDRAALMHETDGHIYARKAAGKCRVRIAALRPIAIANTGPMPTATELLPAL
jgi:hypothetical protein